MVEAGWGDIQPWDNGFTLKNGDETYLTFVQVAEKHSSKGFHRCAVGLNHVAFRVQSRRNIDALKEYCVLNEIPILYDGRYPIDDYYALFIEDPDRIKVEFVAT